MSLQHLDALLSYTGLVSLATTSVYIGSLGSYKPPKRTKNSKSPTDSDSDDEEELTERLSSSDAVWFPIIGSVVLGGFYLAFKYLGDDWINKLMGYYFLITGILCVWNCLTSLTTHIIPPSTYKKRTPKIKLTSLNTSIRLPTLLLFIPSTLPSLFFFFGSTKSTSTTLVSNVLALSFAHTALSTLKLDSLQTGWVFGTSVMVKVATSLNVPIKLLFPRSVLSLLSLVPKPESNPNMLLGLGDVVIPGTLVALAYRLDMHFWMKEKEMKEKDENEKGKGEGKGAVRGGGTRTSYLRATLIGYFTGLSMAFAAMHIFRAAQPALLYLSPTCCLSFIFNAIQRDELGYVWSWEDGAEEKERKEKEKKEKEGKES
ncbi:hypothetical protein FRC09_000367 [Ceratobasidium sp. 395]|nr:hypothetical protein FRC09_000367 [Ceratobasidium sp. 395]